MWLGLKRNELGKIGTWGYALESCWSHIPFEIDEGAIFEFTAFKIAQPMFLGHSLNYNKNFLFHILYYVLRFFIRNLDQHLVLKVS